MTMLRWIGFLPLAVIASVTASAGMAWIGQLADGASWYIWLTSGAAAAWIFFAVAFRVAPRPTAFVKWASVIIVGVFGAMSAAGSIISGTDELRALTGAAM